MYTRFPPKDVLCVSVLAADIKPNNDHDDDDDDDDRTTKTLFLRE